MNRKIKTTSLLLALVAGFCDTSTFVSANGTFSAHITGNFVVFAAQVLHGDHASSWIKLLTLPVFMLAVIITGRLLSRHMERHRLLLLEGLLLLAGGVIAMFGFSEWSSTLIVLLTVAAMGIQNAYGKLFPEETCGVTTVMTGHVTSLALNLIGIVRKDTFAKKRLRQSVVLIGGFLAGCLLGCLASHYFGLAGLMVPAIVVINGYLVCSANPE